jgi:tetratricopeptide (TPR) repeat protein
MTFFGASLLGLFLSAPSPRLPPPADFPRLESEKNAGLAALEEGNLDEAVKRFGEVRKLAPAEPLGWADGAVAALRRKDLPEARSLLDAAARLAPGDARVLALQGVLAEHEGRFPVAVEASTRAFTANAGDLVSRWNAARLLMEKVPGGRTRAAEILRGALEQAPGNTFVLARLFELQEDAGRSAALSALAALSAALEIEVASDPKIERYLAETKAALEAADARVASIKFRIVENLLRSTPRYQQARHDLDPGVIGLPLEEWSPALAAAVRARPNAVPVRFAARPMSGLDALRGLAAVRVGGTEGRDLVFAGESGVTVVPARGGYRPAPPLPGSVASDLVIADVANSGALDIATPAALFLAEASGYRKTSPAAGEAVLPIDFDNDGDLDLYVSSRTGDRLLRNNLDGTWKDVTASALPPGTASRRAAAGDFDRDGDMDLVLVRASGGLELLDNRRGGLLARREAGLPAAGEILAVAAGDLNGDGRPDLVWTTPSAAFVALNRGDGTFLPPRELPASGEPLLFDFDNDGSLDLFLAGAKASSLWRNDGSGAFTRVDQALPAARRAEAVDLDADGDLDLVLVTPDGRALALENQGGNANGWLDVSLSGLPTGSAKVNRFGYGSEIEIKAGQLYVFRTAWSPVTHLGLGPARKADVLRVLWTNGVPQNRLTPPVRTSIQEAQQLKGSCPFLYAHDGRRWRFVTDALGRAPAGLLFDGRHQAAADTREWLVIPADALAPDAVGRLRLDVTEELWETAYLDLTELAAIDHPAGSEVIANEKMVPPPFPRKELFTASRAFIPRAVDERGQDRTGEIARQDGIYLAGFAPTRFQGIVAPHDLVLDLPEARRGGRIMLYLTGWIFYSDTSINVSLSQGGAPAPQPPALEVSDGRGGWKAALPAMGYPAGKTKTVPVDLTGLLDPHDPRVRIRTNLAIFWDRVFYTVGEETAPLRRSAVPLAAARLTYRGFSRMTRETPDGPQVFLHDDVDLSPRWADMAGRYTRYGEVAALLSAADDRYVVMKGGDAVRLEFDGSGLPPPPPGWTRDWLLVLDGWDKDGDKNTVAGQTVEPLPFHGMDDARYGEASQRYPDDEAHRRFREEYLTRRGGPEEFVDAVRRGDRKAEGERR